jgi:predicted solute-binding protein
VTTPVRLGAVSYLNVRPLVYGLEAKRDLVTLRFDVPSLCAKLLADGEIDLGMVPSAAHLERPGDRIVPGVCIGSEGPVASVAIFTRRPIREVRTLALDTSSRTSAALTRVLCARRFDVAPRFITHAPDPAAMLAAADAALIIGDPALFADARGLGAEKVDLGAEWTAMTSLPFVWAFWAGRPDAARPEVVKLLRQAAVDGMRQSDQLADAYCAGEPARQVVARRYLRENLRFELDARALDGLRTFYREAAAVGAVPAAGPIEFFA